jgi:PAS domain S-box-containing protein
MNDLLNYAELIIKIGGAMSVLGGLGLWIYSLNKSVKQILEEVKPNGGKSLKDRVTAIQTQVNKDSNSINTIYSRQKWILDNRPEPIFECNASGSCTWVNEKYCQLLQHDVNYFLDNGWKNGIHSEDRERVENEWQKAIKDRRSNITEYRLVDREGTVIPVKVIAIRNDDNGYIGRIEVIDQQNT